MSRIRRDPRAALLAVTVATRPRLRIDRAHRGDGLRADPAPSAIAETPPRRIAIADPAYLVFAVADAPGGTLTRHDRQVLGAARLLDGGNQAAVVLVAPHTDEDVGALGADRTLPGARNVSYDPEGVAAAIAAAIAHHRPRHVLFPESADGGDLARRVAALLDEPLFDSVENLSARVAIRPATARRLEWRAAPSRLMTIAPDMIAPYRGSPHDAAPLDAPVPNPESRCILNAERVAVDAADIPLDEAALVIAAGNGVTDFAGFLELALALGATPGASRVVCDAGHLPRRLQVGASGTVLNADCYVAFGISGAPQHLQGIGQVEHVIAVNTDLHAAMIARAELAIVADAQAIMPALLDALESRR
ncbi:electron transfer flavoprotein subunit alpha/FixB family protein [Acidiphilium sp. AL]|uniref:electron transfer flavoprotein subunit alpha/FixB family protein n=1 Tax=Acidiphilium sp. AL TaxID=2871704 RepID=UPI0021CAF904|nr:electron transfer flavoprotein subunit alpha/FixB family protein [Acidiphilium sp. AL]MCU4161073.1 electron transfer flavoprotein subunit alpha/FixB family protein [Acidiphilium sp. AL]